MIDPHDLFASSPQNPTGIQTHTSPQHHSFDSLRDAVPSQGFASAQEELDFLRAQIAARQSALESSPLEHITPVGSPESRLEVASSVVRDYQQLEYQQVVHPDMHIHPAEVAEVSLNLKPEEHDDAVGNLYGTMLEKGVKNALAVIESTQNAHLDDDFHRFLVQYLVESGSLPGTKNTSELFTQLDMTLFEITLPRPEENERKTFKEFVAVMEQFYAGMLSLNPLLARKDQGYSLEIASAYGSGQIVFYAGIPTVGAGMFEKHVLGVYPHARVQPVPDDYNIMNPSGILAGGYIVYEHDEILPIKTFEQFESDTLDVVLNVFSKLSRDDEGASVQVIVQPTDEDLYKEYVKVLEKLRKGESFKKIRAGTTLFSFAKDMAGIEDKKEELSDDNAIEKVTQKISSLLSRVTVRIIASSNVMVRAEAIVRDIASAFNQFTDPRSNRLKLESVPEKKLFSFAHEYIYRMPHPTQSRVMNLKELSTIFHFPAGLGDSAELKQSKATTAPAPLDIPKEGILLGTNEHRGIITPIRYAREDRVRHFYIIGQTGTGKTGFLMNMIIQDIKNGDGVCYLDPHGSDVQTILSTIPPERIDDVIYFDPAHTARPMGLNMLEYDVNRPEQMSLIIDEMMNIFNQLFDMQAQGGAMFQQYFKNAAFTVMSHPESGNTLMEISRVMSDKSFRDMKLQHVKNPLVKQFWSNAEATTGDQGLQNFIPYITSKFDPLISNEFLRPIVTQEKSAFNIREVMDNKKILLINLSKGLLGELNANLLGLILIGKIQMAALSRAEAHGVKFLDFYLYIDEFQNFTTPAISSILSEARKYRLSLNVAHQFMAQLDEKIKNAVLGNVGSINVCRISQEDAENMEGYFKPFFGASDITKLENMTSYTRLLVNGVPSEPFNMKVNDIGDVYRSIKDNEDKVKHIKELSYMKFGRPRAEVEAETMEKFDAGLARKKSSMDFDF
jgi:hypothetical protein